MSRLAAAYRQPVTDVLRAVIGTGGGHQITGIPKAGHELFLNAPARARLAGFTALSEDQLAHRLPAFIEREPANRFGDGPAAAWRAEHRPWITACPRCTVRHTRDGQPVRRYATGALSVCVKHGHWLLASWDAARSIPLESFPEVLDAYRRHIRLLRTSPVAEEALAYAAAVVWSWQTAAWPQEQAWPARAHLLAQTMGLKNPPEAAPHTLVTYPEALAVAETLASPQWQRRVLETSPRRRTRASPTAAQEVHAELAQRTGRPWLADILPSMATRGTRYTDVPDLLQHWLDTCLRTRASRDSGGRQELWTIPRAAQRPAHYRDRLNSLCAGARPSGIQAETLGMTGRW